jgi:hypothetical protein
VIAQASSSGSAPLLADGTTDLGSPGVDADHKVRVRRADPQDNRRAGETMSSADWVASWRPSTLLLLHDVLMT